MNLTATQTAIFNDIFAVVTELTLTNAVEVRLGAEADSLDLTVLGADGCVRQNRRYYLRQALEKLGYTVRYCKVADRNFTISGLSYTSRAASRELTATEAEMQATVKEAAKSLGLAADRRLTIFPGADADTLEVVFTGTGIESTVYLGEIAVVLRRHGYTATIPHAGLLVSEQPDSALLAA